jgi:tryptophan synthase beta chain
MMSFNEEDGMAETDRRYFGRHGGRFIPEVLRPAFEEIDRSFFKYKDDKEFNDEFLAVLRDFVGRPTPLYFAENLTKSLGGAKIYFKMEALAHTGAHKINNAVGQALLAKRMGKKRLIAETGAGQHGLATAAVYDGSRTLTDAVNAALKHWTERIDDTHYLIGSALGGHPYPEMVRTFQSIIGREVRTQIMEKEGRLPDIMIACVGGGSNSIGFFHEFLDEKISLIGVEAGGRSYHDGDHASRMNGRGKQGIVQGYRSYFLQNSNGSLLPTHSISAGLDYAGIGPELADLGDRKRIEFVSAADAEVLDAVKLTARSEGIVPALESAHACVEAYKRAPKMKKNEIIVVNISGRGDKDLFITAPYFDTEWKDFLAREIGRLEHGE